MIISIHVCATDPKCLDYKEHLFSSRNYSKYMESNTTWYSRLVLYLHSLKWPWLEYSLALTILPWYRQCILAYFSYHGQYHLTVPPDTILKIRWRENFLYFKNSPYWKYFVFRWSFILRNNWRIAMSFISFL